MTSPDQIVDERQRLVEECAATLVALPRPVPLTGGRSGDWVRGWMASRDEAIAAIRAEGNKKGGAAEYRRQVDALNKVTEAEMNKSRQQPRKATGEMVRAALRGWDSLSGGGHEARITAAVNAALSVSPAAAEGWQPTHRHKKRGTEYMVVGNAVLQTTRLLTDMTPLVIYRSRDGSLWARSGLEFYDGRFEAAAPPLPAQEQEKGERT